MDESPTATLMRALADRSAYDFDSVLLTALQQRLGVVGMTARNVMLLAADGRLRGFVFPDGRSEWSIDGRPFLEAWPAKTELTGNSLRIERAYRVVP